MDENKKKSKSSSCTIWLILLSISLTAATCYYVFFSYFYYEMEQSCLSTRCLKATIDIKSSIDETVDPCENFYEFTCGKFISEAVEKGNPSPYYQITQKTNNQVNALISEESDNPENEDEKQTRPLDLQKKFYRSCYNVTTIDEENNKSVLDILEELGGWPITKDSSLKDWHMEKKFNVLDALIKAAKLGVNFQQFFAVEYGKAQILTVSLPVLSKKYNETYKKDAYLNLIVESAISLGASSRILAKKAAEDILDFKKQLQQIKDLEVNGQEHVNLTAKQLDSIFPRRWYNFLQNITESTNYTISRNDTFKVAENYLRTLNLLLVRTDKRVQANYMIWEIVHEFGLYLSSPLREIFGNFSNLMEANKDQKHNRFEICVEEAKLKFPLVVSSAYIKKYISPEKFKAVSNLIANVKSQFIKRIQDSDWIDDDLKERAVQKVKNIVEIIGNHPFDLDEVVNEKYLGLEFESDNVIDIIRKINIHKFNVQFLVQQFDFFEDILRMSIIVNAAYSDMANLIVPSAALFQDMFFDENGPNYLNYGALGSIIGHEIAHGFGSTATTYDTEEEVLDKIRNGTMEVFTLHFAATNYSLFWPENGTFVNRTQCVLDEYEESEGITGEETYDENFADLIGIDTSYESYLNWIKDNYEEAPLPTLFYTPRQLFWLHFGVVNCYKRIESVEFATESDKHSAFRYRVVNTLRNSKHFAEDFHCPVGTFMNPENKCHIF